MPRERDPNAVPSIPAKVKKAITFLIEEKNDLLAAAEHAGIHIYELRRYLTKPHVRLHMRAERQAALETFVLGSPAALARIRDTSENSMAVVQAVRTGEILQQGALQTEASAQKRAPGLQIVIIQPSGEKTIAYQPTQMIEAEVTPPEAVPVTRPDADME